MCNKSQNVTTVFKGRIEFKGRDCARGKETRQAEEGSLMQAQSSSWFVLFQQNYVNSLARLSLGLPCQGSD